MRAINFIPYDGNPSGSPKYPVYPAAVQTSHAKMDGVSTNRCWHAVWITVVAQSLAVILFLLLLGAALTH